MFVSETDTEVIPKLAKYVYDKQVEANGPADFVTIVKITLRPSGGGEEVVVDYRERGESFGLVSLMGGQQKTTILALQDTLCYLLPKDRLNALLAGHPAVTEYLLQFHLTKYVAMTAREIQGKSLFLGSSDHRLFTARLKELRYSVAGFCRVSSAWAWAAAIHSRMAPWPAW